MPRVALALLVTGSVATGQLEFNPVEVPAGPLLFSIRADKSSGERVNVHYLQAPEGRGKPRAFLRCDHNVKVLHRLGRRRFLMKNHGDPYGLFAVNLETGATTRLLEATNNELSTVQDGRVLFAVNVVPPGFGFRREKPAAPIGSAFLWSWDTAGDKAAKRVFEAPIARRWKMRDGAIVVLTATGPRALWRIDSAGKAHARLLGLPAGLDLGRVELSPDGRRLALGVKKRRGFDLRVFEVKTQKVIREISAIQCDISARSSSSPRLEFVWLDDGRIRYSESYTRPAKGSRRDVDRAFTGPDFRFIDVDVASGERLGSVPYGSGLLSHETPPLGRQTAAEDASRRRSQGPFDSAGSKLYYRGMKQVLVDTKEGWDWPRYSADGRFFAIMRSGMLRKGKWRGVIFDGKTRTQQELEVWCYDLTWMPATGH